MEHCYVEERVFSSVPESTCSDVQSEGLATGRLEEVFFGDTTTHPFQHGGCFVSDFSAYRDLDPSSLAGESVVNAEWRSTETGVWRVPQVPAVTEVQGCVNSCLPRNTPSSAGIVSHEEEPLSLARWSSLFC